MQDQSTHKETYNDKYNRAFRSISKELRDCGPDWYFLENISEKKFLFMTLIKGIFSRNWEKLELPDGVSPKRSSDGSFILEYLFEGDVFIFKVETLEMNP